MARLPRTGSAISSLYERPAGLEEMIFEDLVVLFLVGLASQDEIVKAFDEIVKSLAELGLTTTLPEVISDLGLAPLSPDDEQKVRHDLMEIVGRRMQEDARPQITKLQTRLRRVARGLNAVAAGRCVRSQAIRQFEQILHARETGLHSAYDITTANEIVIAFGRHKRKNSDGKPLPDIEENTNSAEPDFLLAAPEPTVETESREPTSPGDNVPALEDVDTPKVDGVPSIAPGESTLMPNAVRKEALWLWGRLQEFISAGLLDKAPQEIMAALTPPIREEMRTLAPKVATWLLEHCHETRRQHRPSRHSPGDHRRL